MMVTFFLTILTLKILLKLFLSVRNQRYVTLHKNSVPTPFQSSVTLAEHQKAHDYTITNAKSMQFFLIIDTLILLFWIFGGGINSLHHFAQRASTSEIGSSIIFFLSFSLINLFFDLPQSIYQTFYVETKFGFNRTTPKLFIMDMVKQILIGLLIAPPLIAGIIWIMLFLGNYWWFFAFLFITFFQFFMMLIYPTFIAPLFNKFQPLPEGELKDQITKLLQKIHFPHKGLFIMDASKRSSHGNAYFTGFGKSKRIVLFDTLLKSLSVNEATAVLAHELGHFKKKHILKGMVVSIIMSFIGLALLGYLYNSDWFFQNFGNIEKTTYTSLLLFSLISPPFTFFLTPIFSFFSRKNEFEADEFAKKYASGDDLINALIKLYKENSTTLTPDPLYSSFYFSHPPAIERIHHLTEKKIS